MLAKAAQVKVSEEGQINQTTIVELIMRFERFNQDEINSAIGELTKINTESNRKHLQRLVYVNLVNRFDSLIDAILLKFSLKECEFKRQVLNKIKEEPIFLKDVYEIVLSENPKSTVEHGIGDVVRLHFLNQRHSSKLRTLLRGCFSWSDQKLNMPRVFVNDGSIFNKTKKISSQIPDSVIGYADWLYSRRNVLVHHDRPEMMKSDIEYMKKAFKVNPSISISLKISSIKSAARFYIQLLKLLKKVQTDDIIND